jgi:glycosyltransferase involved in cell wall biosynthesis
MGKIRLLHFFSPLKFGGGETFVINFLRASTRNFDNKIVLFSSSSEFSAELDALGNTVVIIKMLNSDMGSGKRSSYISLLFQIVAHPFKLIAAIKKSGDYDFLIGHGFPFNFILPLLRAMRFIGSGEKIVYFQHHRLMSSSGSALQRMIYRKLFSYFDVIIANSPDVRNDILSLDKRLSAKITIYSVGLDFDYIKERAEGKSAIDIPTSSDRVIAVYPARFMPHKNHRIFEKIFSKLKNDGMIDKFFMIFSAGDGDFKNSFKNKIMEDGYEKNCFFPERLGHDDLLHTMASSDLCIFPSLEEGFGLGILECLILGVPVVSFRSAIPAELAAFTLSVETEEDFIDITCRLVSNEVARREAGKALRGDYYRLLKEKFDLGETSARLRDIFAGLLEATGV